MKLAEAERIDEGTEEAEKHLVRDARPVRLLVPRRVTKGNECVCWGFNWSKGVSIWTGNQYAVKTDNPCARSGLMHRSSVSSASSLFDSPSPPSPPSLSLAYMPRRETMHGAFTFKRDKTFCMMFFLGSDVFVHQLPLRFAWIAAGWSLRCNSLNRVSCLSVQYVSKSAL